jgi:hypothetical protein
MTAPRLSPRGDRLLQVRLHLLERRSKHRRALRLAEARLERISKALEMEIAAHERLCELARDRA